MAREWVRRYLPDAAFEVIPSCDRITNKRIVLFLYRMCTATLFRGRALRKCDVLLATSHILPDIVPAIVWRGRRTAVIIWHILDVPWKRGGSLGTNVTAFLSERVALSIVRRWAGAVITGTSAMLREARIADRKNLRVGVTTNGVPAALEATPPGKELRSGVLYLGRLHPAKGCEDLVRAWSLVSAEVPNARLTIAGRGPHDYTSFLENLASELGIRDRICFLPSVDEAQKIALLQASTLFAFPSKEEGWGIVLAEAMAAGLPCVTYRLPVFDEIFPVGRRSVAIDDVAGFADQIVTLLSNDALCDSDSQSAYELSRGFRWKEAARREMDVIRRIARKPEHEPAAS